MSELGVSTRPCLECYWALTVTGFNTTTGAVTYCCHAAARVKSFAPVAETVREDKKQCGPMANWFNAIPPEEYIALVRGVSARPQKITAPQYTPQRKAAPYKVPT